jgi:hypothetical protein
MKQMKSYYHADPKGHYEKYGENKAKWVAKNREHVRQYKREYDKKYRERKRLEREKAESFNPSPDTRRRLRILAKKGLL